MNNNTSISRVFSKKVFDELLSLGDNVTYNYVVDKYIDKPHGKTNKEIISEIYSIMGNTYRSEYFYMNTLLNKLLIGIHNVNTATALSQVRIADHIADFVLINGVGRVYEIKSDLDNLSRLNEQLKDYYKAFSYVSVLSSEQERDKVESQLKKLGRMGDSVGIYVLSDNCTIFNRDKTKEPKAFNDALDSYTIFTLLRKIEYEKILKRYFGYLPEVPPVFYFRKCFNMFDEIPILEAQELTIKELKKRSKATKEFMDFIPYELKSVAYFYRTPKDINKFSNFLEQSYGG